MAADADYRRLSASDDESHESDAEAPPEGPPPARREQRLIDYGTEGNERFFLDAALRRFPGGTGSQRSDLWQFLCNRHSWLSVCLQHRDHWTTRRERVIKLATLMSFALMVAAGFHQIQKDDEESCAKCEGDPSCVPEDPLYCEHSDLYNSMDLSVATLMLVLPFQIWVNSSGYCREECGCCCGCCAPRKKAEKQARYISEHTLCIYKGWICFSLVIAVFGLGTAYSVFDVLVTFVLSKLESQLLMFGYLTAFFFWKRRNGAGEWARLDEYKDGGAGREAPALQSMPVGAPVGPAATTRGALPVVVHQPQHHTALCPTCGTAVLVDAVQAAHGAVFACPVGHQFRV